MVDQALKDALNGVCPECKRNVRDYKPPFGSFAPEAFATLREMGINTATGHKVGCGYDPAESEQEHLK